MLARWRSPRRTPSRWPATASVRLRFFKAQLTVPAAALLAAGIGYASARSPIGALASLGVAVLLVFLVAQPYALLLVLVAALPWEGMLGFPSETLSIVKILGLLLFASTLVAIVRGERPLYAPPTGLAAAIFVLLIGVSLLFSPDLLAGVGKTVRYVLFAVFFFVVIQLVVDRRRLLTILQVLSASVIAAAAWGLVGFLAGANERASGPIVDPNDFGYLMAATLPLILYFATEKRPTRWLYALGLLVVMGAIFATLSRSVLVGVVVALSWALFSRRISVGGVVATTLAATTVLGIGLLAWSPLIGERVQQKSNVAGDNVASRAALWKGAIEMSMDHPLVGVGPGRFGQESVTYVRDNPEIFRDPVTHNTYLEILAESGPLALAAFLALLTGTWISLGRQYRLSKAQQNRAALRLVTSMQAALLISVVSAVTLSEQLATPFWLLGSLAAIASKVLGDVKSSGAALTSVGDSHATSWRAPSPV